MTPKINPAALDAVLALAAVDFVADKISDVPAPTALFLNGIWNYGRRPPLVPGETYDPEEAEALSWYQALYVPGMAHVLSNMRLRAEPDTSGGWFHDAVFIAALLSFRLIEAAEYLSLPDDLQSPCPSDVAEIQGIGDDFIEACGQAMENVEEFERHFTEARARFEAELADDDVPRWPPFAGITRAGAEEWFA